MERSALKRHQRRREARRKGQILLAVAVVISVLIMSVAMLTYATSVTHGRFQFQPYVEISSAIGADFGRALLRILARVTQEYNYTSDINIARATANRMFTNWVLVANSAFSARGAVIRPAWTTSEVQPPKTLYGYNYSGRSVYNLTKLYWYRPQSMSAIGASVSIEIPSMGFFGFRNSFLFLLNVTIDVPSINVDKKGGTVSFRLIVLREDEEPIFDLTATNILVRTFDPTASTSETGWKPATVVGLKYEGQGSYVVTFRPQLRVAQEASSYWNYYYKYLCVTVSDSRGIMVEAYSYSGIEFEADERSGIPFSAGGRHAQYVLEVLSNSTTLWFGKGLDQPTSPPVPPVPKSQLWVQTYVSAEGWKDTPAQVETWEQGQRFPSLEQIGIPSRFLERSRLVFVLDFPPSVDELRYRITWQSDCDYHPTGEIAAIEADNNIRVNNGYYIATVLSADDPAAWQNFTLRLQVGTFWADYWLFGYDSAEIDGALLIPRKVPYGRWAGFEGPVRSVVFRRSSAVIDRLYRSTTNEEALHEMALFFPRDESYFYWQMTVTWKQPFQLSNRFMRMFAVTATPGIDFGSLVESDGVNIINGSFAGRLMMHRDLRFNEGEDYGHWSAVYCNGFGASMFLPESTLVELGSFGEDQLWAWTSNTSERVMEFDMMYFRTPAVQFTVDPYDPVTGRGAGWLYEGGTADAPYSDDTLWRQYPDAPAMLLSTAVDIPQVYHRMFLDGCSPSLTSARSI